MTSIGRGLNPKPYTLSLKPQEGRGAKACLLLPPFGNDPHPLNGGNTLCSRATGPCSGSRAKTRIRRCAPAPAPMRMRFYRRVTNGPRKEHPFPRALP